MGNNHSRDGSPKHGISRNSSGVDLHDKVPSQLLPIDKLAKLLTQKTLEEDSIENGVSVGTFVRYLFPKYPELGKQLFGYWQNAAGVSPTPAISTAMFKAQVDKLMTVMTDEQQIQMYVVMYADNAETMNTEQFHSLLLTVYKISMDHYPDGPQSCRQLFKTLHAIINSAFHKKDSLPVVYLAHWLEEHCKRLVTVLHRYVVHILTTGFHSVTERLDEKDQGLELTTPVLEKAPVPWDKPQPLLPVSQVWILACTLPPLFVKPQHHSPVNVSNNGFCSKNYLARILDLSCPSHWTMLYNSLQHGLGANRFLHHVLSYRGPTLTFLRGEQDIEFCIAATHEWQESHLYWGGEDSIIVQILPLYHVVQRGPKLLYLNTKIRGYPKGIRAGLDPRKPSIDINESFTYVTYKGIPYQLQSIEVWGCGTPQSREMQLDIKKWEVKQAERQRVVKLSANEWTDHPDRYLLELAGRPNYSQSNN